MFTTCPDEIHRNVWAAFKSGPATQQFVGNLWDQRCCFEAVCTPLHTDCWSKNQTEDCKPDRMITIELCPQQINQINLHSPREPFKVGTAGRFWVNSDYIDKVAVVVDHSNLTKGLNIFAGQNVSAVLQHRWCHMLTWRYMNRSSTLLCRITSGAHTFQAGSPSLLYLNLLSSSSSTSSRL